eukprot:jgi/Galph1/3691/GphlegSOOS_G2352.1
MSKETSRSQPKLFISGPKLSYLRLEKPGLCPYHCKGTICLLSKRQTCRFTKRRWGEWSRVEFRLFTLKGTLQNQHTAYDSTNKISTQKQQEYYKTSINLPSTRFEQRANSSVREVEIQKFWEENAIYEKVLEKNSSKTFFLHDGPPYANGALHIGHALNKILKDIICRYRLLRGYYACFIPGWDCHGLPIELKVWQNISKEESATMSVTELRRRAAAFAEITIEEQKQTFKRFGIWGTWSNPYLTMSPAYEAAQIQVFGEMFLRGYIYRARKPVHWSPSSRTALAEAELEYPDDHMSTAVYVTLPIVSDFPTTKLDGTLNPSSRVELAVWTTTPWTLPANEGVAINPKMVYTVIEVPKIEKVLVVAKDCLDRLLDKLCLEREKDIRIIGQLIGKDLVGCKYSHPLKQDKKCPVVIGGDYITAESGTGLVHTAPGHGEEDYEVGRREHLPISCPVDEHGLFTEEASDFLMGKSVLGEGNHLVIDFFEKKNQLLVKERYAHKYPYDWRTKEPTIYRTTEQWFASLKGFRDEVLSCIEQVNWIPETKKNLIRSMVSERTDWCISRQRSWGVPIPVFYDMSNGSSPVLDKEILEHVLSIIRKHGSDAWFRLSVDELLPAKHRGRNLLKGTDTMDVWFDSGCSWAAITSFQHRLQLPADLYLEGGDQHRGWFQSSLLTCVATRGHAPYKEALTHGFVLDEKGVKMSKSTGNVVDPQQIVNGGKDLKKEPVYGADVLRLWVSSVDYKKEVLIGPNIIRQVADSYRKLRNTLRYMIGNLYDFNMDSNGVPLDKLPQLDLYILNLFGQFRESIQISYEKICTTELSNFYFDIAKDRLYVSFPDSFRRRSCQTVLYLLLEDLVHIIAPILPHTAEDVWQCFDCRQDPAMSVFQSGWFSNRSLPEGTYTNGFWEFLRSLRDIVNKCLERAREDHEIGSSLESRIGIYVVPFESEMSMTFCQQLAEFIVDEKNGNEVDKLKYLFLTSQVEIINSEEKLKEQYSYIVDSDNSKLPVSICLIGVAKAHGSKCIRCWNFSESVGLHSKHPELCHRCVDIVDRLLSQ